MFYRLFLIALLIVLLTMLLFVLLFFLVIVVLVVIVCSIVCFIVSRVHHGLALKMFLFLDGAQLVQPISYKHTIYYMALPTRVRKNTFKYLLSIKK